MIGLLLGAFAWLAERHRPASLGSTVDFRCLATPLKRLLPDLSTTVHERLAASGSMQNCVVCIQVHGVGANELLAKIAKATGGEWEGDHGTITLVPDPVGRQHITELARSARTALIADGMTQFTASARPKFNPHVAVMNPDPVFRSFLESVGAKALAAIPPGGRAVFSTKPTGRQLRMADDKLAVAEYLQRQPDNKVNRPRGPSLLADLAAGAKGQLEGPFSKLDLVVHRHETALPDESDALSCSLYAYRSDGTVVRLNDTGMIFDQPGQTASEYERSMSDFSSPTPPSQYPTEKVIALSPEAAALARDLDLEGRESLTLGQRVGLRKLLAEPDKHDPLAGWSEVLVAAAATEGRQLVASLPDTCFDWFESGLITKLRPSDAVDMLRRDSNLVVQSENEWTVASPGDFTREPVDRDALAKMIRRLRDKRDCNLDDLLALTRLEFNDASPTLLTWVGLAVPNVEVERHNQDWEALQMLASLSPVAFAALERDGFVTIGGPAANAEPIASFVYAGSLVVEHEPTGDYDSDGRPWVPADRRGEPTELLGQGLGAGVRLEIRTKKTPLLWPAVRPHDDVADALSEDIARWTGGVVALRLKRHAHGLKGLTSAEVDELERQYDSVQLGGSYDVELRTYVNGEAFRHSKFKFLVLEPDTVYTLKTLPPDLQKEYDHEFEVQSHSN